MLDLGAFFNWLILFFPKRRFMSKENIMIAKKYLVAAIILSTVAPAFAASDCQHPACETRRNAKDFNQTALAGPGKFGPVIETILPDAGTDRSVEMVDLETGRALVQPPIEYFNSRAEAIMGWI